MTRFVQYRNGVVVAEFGKPQPDAVDGKGNTIAPGVPTTEVADDHPDLLAFRARQTDPKKTNILQLESQYPVTQRFLREALMFVAERFPEIKASPGYQKIASGEAKIAANRVK